MTDILPPAGWPNVRQLETNEFATGGANGNMNEQAKSLAARSELLKKYAALPYESKTGDYALNERLQLATGDIVRSTIPNNVNNPNENMTGWVKTNSASQILDENGKTQQTINNTRSVSVKDYFTDEQLADCLTASPTLKYSDAFQAAVDAAIANGSNSIFIPFDRGERYQLDKTVNIPTSGFAILGNRAPSYHIHLRGGRIAADLGVTDFFNYGVGGTYDSNQLVVDGVAALGLGDAPRTQTFVKMDQNNNGPHRGVNFKSCSGRGLNDVLFITATTESNLGAASVVFDNTCCFISNQNTCNTNRRVFNLLMSGIQSEAGARINGKWDGGVSIRDNMLEGQSDVITIDSNQPSVILENNYFEFVQGNYLSSTKGTNVNALFVERPNYLSSVSSVDIHRLTGQVRLYAPYRTHLRSERSSLYSLINVITSGGTLFDGAAYVGTTGSSDGGRGYCDPKSLREPRATAKTNVILGTDILETPFGRVYRGKKSTGVSDYFTINSFPVEVGDVVVATCLIKIPKGEAINMSVYANTGELIGSFGQSTIVEMNAGWHVAYVALASAYASTTIRVRITSTSEVQIAGVGADITKVADFKTFNGVKRAEIQLFNPCQAQIDLERYRDVRTLTIPAILADQTYTTTAISVYECQVGDAVVCTPNVDMQGMYWFARVSAANTIELRIVNPTAASVTLGSVQWKTRVFK